MKAISLLSGGLDSILAAKLIIGQNIDVEAVYFHTPFCDCNMPQASCKISRKSADLLKVPFHKVELEEEFLDMVRNPKHGYGKNINPCIDCRIMQFKKAKELMRELGAGFIITGEVLNERPMSQRRPAMENIDKEAGVQGLILRPLSAKMLKETMPEKEGVVDRKKLLDIEGRSRKRQIELAKFYGIGEYLTPSGGCLLTYAGSSDKVRDLIKYSQLTMAHARLLKLGRHFRLDEKAKFIVGKDDAENERISAIKESGAIFLNAQDFPGPMGVLPDGGSKESVELAASVLAYYVNKAGDAQSLNIAYRVSGGETKGSIAVTKITKPLLDGLRVTRQI